LSPISKNIFSLFCVWEVPYSMWIKMDFLISFKRKRLIRNTAEMSRMLQQSVFFHHIYRLVSSPASYRQVTTKISGFVTEVCVAFLNLSRPILNSTSDYVTTAFFANLSKSLSINHPNISSYIF
jgi:hypothetical protein